MEYMKIIPVKCITLLDLNKSVVKMSGDLRSPDIFTALIFSPIDSCTEFMC